MSMRSCLTVNMSLENRYGAIIGAHILMMVTAFGIVFPIGLVCGLTRSRFHVPVQTLGGTLAVTGYFLGHAHKGRQYPAHNIHSTFGSWVMVIALIQIGIGITLKLHLEKGILGKIRKGMVGVHLVIAVLFPIISWVQMGFGAITIVGFCHEDHLGQCLAHGIMGSSFIAYGFILLMMLYVGENFLTQKNKSQEFYDSLIITLWGIVNTFTEHRWGQDWSHKDFQHTSMGIIWWAAGLVGIYLSWDRNLQQPRRNHIPAIVMIFTGYSMSQHSQNLEVSTKVHAMFGIALMTAGLVRIIEISFILKDRPHSGQFIRSWQFLTPFLLVESGILFMGASEEQMQLLYDIGIMHSSYILVMSSVAFIIYLLMLFLMNLYMSLSGGSGDARSNPGLATSQHMTMTHRRNPDLPSGGIEMQPFLTEEEELGLDELEEDEDLNFTPPISSDVSNSGPHVALNRTDNVIFDQSR